MLIQGKSMEMISSTITNLYVFFSAFGLNIFQLYHGENMLTFNEKSALYYTNALSWILIVLAHRNNSPRINILSHSDTLS